MTFSERVAADPFGFFAAFFVWIPVAVWVVSVVGWMVSGDLEALGGIVAIGVAIGLGVLTAAPPDPRLSPLFFGVTVLTVVMYPFVRTAAHKHAHAKIDIEQIDRHAETLRRKPNDLGAMFRLAELLYKRGLPAQAIALGEKALTGMPANLFRPEHTALSAWKAQATSPGLFRPVACLRCHEPNPPGNLNCASCGYPYVVELAKGRLLGPNTAKQLVAVWIAIVIALVGLPSAAKVAEKSPAMAVVLMAVQVTAGCAILLRSFLRGGHRETA